MDKREKTVAFVDGVLDGIRALPHTFEALLGHIERSYGKRRYAISFDEDGRKVGESYREMAALSRDLGSRLRQILGGKPSEAPVALKYRNSPEWPSLFYAILASGHPVLLLDARLPKANAENLLRQAGAIAIITNESEPFSVPSYRLADLKKARPGAKGAWADHVLFCSSGTTGDAKIVVFDGERAFAQIDSARDIASETQELVYDGPIRNFAMIPFHHIFGFVAVFLWFTALGKTLVYPSSMATKDLLYAIRKGRCTHVFSVPLLWDGVAQTIRRTFHLKGEKEAEGVRANKRNGTSKKRVKTDIGVAEIDLPRDRNGTFKPILIPKHARTFGGLDSCRLVAMYALGTSSRDISAFIKELYGIRASQEYIGTVTESVLQDIESWRRTRSTGCTRRSSSTPFTSTSETA